jgi:hypothetical protein
MPREEGEAERREGVFDRQYEVYKESYEQRGLSEEQAQRKADEELETGSEHRAESDRG